MSIISIYDFTKKRQINGKIITPYAVVRQIEVENICTNVCSYIQGHMDEKIVVSCYDTQSKLLCLTDDHECSTRRYIKETMQKTKIILLMPEIHAGLVDELTIEDIKNAKIPIEKNISKAWMVKTLLKTVLADKIAIIRANIPKPEELLF